MVTLPVRETNLLQKIATKISQDVGGSFFMIVSRRCPVYQKISPILSFIPQNRAPIFTSHRLSTTLPPPRPSAFLRVQSPSAPSRLCVSFHIALSLQSSSFSTLSPLPLSPLTVHRLHLFPLPPSPFSILHSEYLSRKKNKCLIYPNDHTLCKRDKIMRH